MKTIAWKDLNHKVTPERRAEIKQEALEEYDRMGFAAIRKARQQTQVELAKKLGVDQASVSAIESRTDLLLSTMTKYIRALGGDIEIRAVFPEATFNLETLFHSEPVKKSAQPTSKRRAPIGQKPTKVRTKKAAIRA
jgi:DNA-binding XRE family transcriptional regulator